MYRIIFEHAEANRWNNKSELRMIIMQRAQHDCYKDMDLDSRPHEVIDILSVDQTAKGVKALFAEFLNFTALKDMNKETDRVEEIRFVKDTTICKIEDHHALRDTLVEQVLKLMIKKGA